MTDALGSTASILQAGGTLVPGQHIYIARPEDAELLKLIRTGQYVNILSARQMGKSSLMVRTMQDLRGDGVRTTAVDLAAELSGAEGSEAWYRGLLGRLSRDLNLGFNVGAFWSAYQDDTPGQKLQRFFREIAVPAATNPLVVFLDEIDSSLKFDFTDSLFTALRGIYNERGLVSAYAGVTFVLLGVATPNELIKDRRTTPYNVGENLELRNFDIEHDDLSLLSRELVGDVSAQRALLARILHWTGGQPFLTVRICADVRNVGATSAAEVDSLIDAHFGNLNLVGQNVHFVQIERFLQERVTDPQEVLDLYDRVLGGQRIREQPSVAHLELKLSGLVRRAPDGMLTLNNRIYARLFDEVWLSAELQRRARVTSIADQRTPRNFGCRQ